MQHRIIILEAISKIIFWPNFCVGSKFKSFEILHVFLRLKFCSALSLNQNIYFEIASKRRNRAVFGQKIAQMQGASNAQTGAT